MPEKVEVEGYDAYVQEIQRLKKLNKPVFVLFSGSADPTTGHSWCPDCVVASPIVKTSVEKCASEESVFLYVNVGPRSFWKDPNNSFRKDPEIKLKSVPTLIKVGHPQRLEEGQCAKADMVEMLFED